MVNSLCTRSAHWTGQNVLDYDNTEAEESVDAPDKDIVKYGTHEAAVDPKSTSPTDAFRFAKKETEEAVDL
jgi:hypothetical protein